MRVSLAWGEDVLATFQRHKNPHYSTVQLIRHQRQYDSCQKLDLELCDTKMTLPLGTLCKKFMTRNPVGRSAGVCSLTLNSHKQMEYPTHGEWLQLTRCPSETVSQIGITTVCGTATCC
jgi:hypothetical protein